jgi:hypothetical protein
VCNSRDAIPLKFSDYVIKSVLGTGAARSSIRFFAGAGARAEKYYKVLNFHITHLKVVGAGAASFARTGANDAAPKNKTM